MSSNEDKNQKKSKRSFISKLPSFRRKKSPAPETPPPKSTSRTKKHKNENASNAKASIAKETQTPKHTPKYQDKSTSRFTDDAERGLTTLKEEEQNGNNAQPKAIKSTSNLNTTSIFATTTATSFTNPVYEGDVWSLQNQKRKEQKEQKGGQVASREINANISGKQQQLGSPTGAVPLSPVKTSSYQHIVRCSSVTSTLSSGSSLSLSSPGSLTKLIAGPKPYKSVFGDEQRGIKRQGSTPSDIEFGSSCVSVSGSVSSLSPTVEDVATKVTVRSGSVPGLHKYHPFIAPIESLSPVVSPKHKRDRSRREGAYTYDSSGCESEDSSKKRTLTRENVDHASVAEKRDGDISPTSIVNLNFDLQSAAAASPLLNVNVRRDRQKFLANGAPCASEEPTHKALTAQQESPCSAEPVKEEALISQAQAAPPSCGLTNNNPELVESTHEASIPRTETHVGSDSRLSPPQPQPQQVKSSSPLSTRCNNAAATAGQSHDENSDQALLTRVRSVTSPIPIKTTPRTFYPPQHLQLSAMRNKLRSESFDSSDLDSLASDDLMCEAETFMDPSDESLLTHRSSSMPAEHGFSPCPNSAKGKRMRNNSIEFLVASFDKRHRHHSTGESPRGYSGSVRGVRVGGTGPGTGRDMVVLEANTYRHMVQELSSMKMALVKLSKMLQDPKALSEMLSAVNEGRDTETVTMDSVVQCELIQEQVPTETQVEVSSCEAAMQCDAVQKEDRAVQSDVTITGCIRCEGRMKADRKQAAPAILRGRPASTPASYRSREGCLSISSSSSAGGEGDEECLRGSWKGSSGLDQGALSPLGNSHSSGDTSDDSIRQRSVKAPRKHVRISDEVSSSPQTSRPKIPSPRASSLSKVKREKVSSSDEGSQGSSSRLKQPTVRFGFRVKNGSQRTGQDLSSSDDGNGSSGRVVCRRRNQSDSSNEGSEDSGSIPEKSRLPQMRRPVSKMQRPRQIQRPAQRPTPQKGRRQDSRGGLDARGIPHASKPQKSVPSMKGDIRQHQEPVKPSQLQDQQANLEWQQLQLQQQQEKQYKQQVAAHKQQMESQQRMQSQQQQLQRDQQERAAANLQHQQDMLLEQQQQQLQRQQQQQQQWQQQQQRSMEAVQPKVVSRPQGKILKQSSNQDLTFTQRKSAEAVKAAQEHWHSSPDLIENQGPPHTHAATVHNAENQNRSESQKPKSRLVAPSAVSRLPSSKQMLAKREPGNPQTRNVSNGIPGPRSKLASPMSPRRSISMPANSNVSKGPKQSPLPERRIPEGTVSPRHGASQLHVNQNNNPLTSVPATNQQETTTFTTTVTTVTTTMLPMSSNTQTSKLPSPSRSIPKPVSRLAQPKVKVQSRIPKGPAGVSTKGRESN